LTPLDLAGDDALARTQATDVRHSVIVQAPAGSGKTTLLVDRLLNLLAIVDRPEEILAITFTRKAAAEMRNRVSSAIRSNDAVRARSQALGWRLEEQSSRLRIQTIDSFAAALVHRLPIASGFGADVRILDDTDSLYREAVDRVFEGLERDSPFRGELIRVLELFDNDYDRARTSVTAMLRRRDQWLEVAMSTLRAGTVGLDEAERENVVGRAITTAIHSLHRSAIDDLTASLDAELRAEIAAHATEAAVRLDRPWGYSGLPDDVDGWRFIAELIITSGGEPRARLGRAQGFHDNGPANQLAKARLRALIDALSHRHLIRQIGTLRELPDTPVVLDEVTSILAIATGLALCAIELAKLFRRERAIDFAELAFAAHRALGAADAPTDLALALDHQIKHVLIDEFQDTSAIQHRLFVRLLQEWQPDDTRTLFVVGDPMQSIYRFRDADVALFQRARRDGIAALHPASIRLTRNFRAAAALVDWCNNAFAAAFGDVEDPNLGQVSFSPSVPTHRDRGDDGCRTYIADANDAGPHEAAALVRTVEQIRRTHPAESIAILARSRGHLAQVLPQLTQAGVPWVGTDIDPLAERPVISDLMSLVRALSSDADRLAWLAFLRAPFVGISLRDLEVVAQAYGGPASAVRLGTYDHQVSHDGRVRFERIRPILERAEAGRGQQRVRQWIETVFIRLGGADAYADPDATTHVQRFLELIDDGHARVLDLTALANSISRLFAQASATPDSVVVMTIHRAKGLEFDHVLLPELHRAGRLDDPPPLLWRTQGEQLLLGIRDVETPRSLFRWLHREAQRRDANELVRLLYVAATRARHSLHLFATLERDESGWRGPPARSLLAPIWHHIASRVEVIHAVDTPSTTAPQRTYRALPASYEWNPAVRDDL
jgi:ATP-dependent exoDNAse (exonuclease V) beta subunit